MIQKKISLSALAVLTVSGIAVAIAASKSSESSQIPVSFNEVWSIVSDPQQSDRNHMAMPTDEDEIQAILDDQAAYGEPHAPTLPQYSSGLQVVKSWLSGRLEAAARRTTADKSDYYDYFQKLVHANGACFAGTWEITAESSWTGAFAPGAKMLIIGRLSTANPETTKNKERSFGFAGKIFPTQNPDAAVPTANFFTVHDLNGTMADHVLDVKFVNEPPVDLGGVVNPLRVINEVFAKTDFNPGFRPVYPLAYAGLAAGEKASSPRWIRISLAPGVQNPSANDADFRDEVSRKNYPEGLTFIVEASNTTKETSASAKGWLELGRIKTGALVTSFGCDRRLHFPHMKLKDPNQ